MQHKISKQAFVSVLAIFFFFGFSVLGQTEEKKPLYAVIQQLEQKYDIRFSYVPEEIAPIFVTLSKETESLPVILKQLNNQTPLQFTLLDDRYVTVVSPLRQSKLCGRIMDAQTGKPLEGANIITETNRFSTTSSAEGFFTLSEEISNNTSITISFIGYYPMKISVEQLKADCPIILLQPETAVLDEVVIQTFLVQGISKKTNGSIAINTENFGLVPGQVENDVLQISQALPGVESADETISNINIRGGTHDENLLLWDDIKMYQSGHFFGLISAFNPDLTKQVTVYKNGTPPRFGESVSGVIDMRSKNRVSEEFAGGVGVNLINASAFIDIPLSKKASVQVSGRHSLSFLETPVYNTYSERIFQDTEITNLENPGTETKINAEEDFSFYDFSTKLLWDVSEKDALRVNFLTIDNSLDFTESISGANQSKTSELQQRSLVGGISWKRNWSERFETTAMVYGSYYLLNATNKDLFTTQQLFQENEVLEDGAKIDSRYNISEKINVQSGYQFSEIGIGNTQDVNIPRFRVYNKEVLRSHSVFSNLTYTPNQQNTVINAGARLSYFSKFNELLVEPRLSVHQKLGNGFSVDVQGEFKSQSTTQRIDFQSDFLGIEKRRWVLANNEDVPILESKQASVGLGYQKNKWLVSLEGFYKTVNGITTSNQGFQNQFQFVKARGSYSAKGLEFVFNRKTKRFSAWISYLLMKNDYEFESLIPSAFPNNIDIRHAATVAGSYSLNDLKLALGINWHSGKPYTTPIPGNEITVTNGQPSIQYASPNTERLPDYFRADFSAEYIWGISDAVDAKINIAVLNLLNRKNTLNIRYALDTDKDGENRVNQVEEISLGLTPNVSVQVLF
ncbi:carboxypeptidase-like regulatory domain-containing protein [Marixanthomonas spongiae]|uniref:TonB-dependent receptor n=1 Tax=Marixanthomonas spongiae TaxID=2174845 RepID=A0A2U0HX37_9FLAO|nr:carboxypeptidase-like regulatory domain-containing protein [Marixanthomonas spongiae]PVW13396.1 hypothetical protein DDV96_13600 [Marixanthomonas spongiae]